MIGVFFHLDLFPTLLALMLLLGLGTVGFVAAGTLFSALTVRTRARDLALSTVVFPLCAPALIAGVVGTREALGGAPFAETLDFVRILLAFDLVFITAGIAYLIFLLPSDRSYGKHGRSRSNTRISSTTPVRAFSLKRTVRPTRGETSW